MRKSLSCNKCSYTTSSNAELIEHIRKHSVNIPCQSCNYIARNVIDLREHKRVRHPSKTVRFSQEYNSNMNQQNRTMHKATKSIEVNTQYCHYWNNYGKCQYEFKNNRPCKFSHSDAPRCKFDGQCNRKSCMFKHYNQNMSFLVRTQ